MENFETMIRNTFKLGSIRDAQMLFENIIRQAFPTAEFHQLELVRFLQDEPYMEGRSWNHVFEVSRLFLDNYPVWEVRCHRVTMGQTPDKHVFLDFGSLELVRYMEQ